MGAGASIIVHTAHTQVCGGRAAGLRACCRLPTAAGFCSGVVAAAVVPVRLLIIITFSGIYSARFGGFSVLWLEVVAMHVLVDVAARFGGLQGRCYSTSKGCRVVLLKNIIQQHEHMLLASLGSSVRY
eukprot:m.1017696 g.1017696  ORF g.1017696 m.1017696 type:complete len:128 (-) comp24084_c0_seq50:1547-1930(-)